VDLRIPTPAMPGMPIDRDESPIKTRVLAIKFDIEMACVCGRYWREYNVNAGTTSRKACPSCRRTIILRSAANADSAYSLSNE
jgi:hypothetical protein